MCRSVDKGFIGSRGLSLFNGDDVPDFSLEPELPPEDYANSATPARHHGLDASIPVSSAPESEGEDPSVQ